MAESESQNVHEQHQKIWSRYLEVSELAGELAHEIKNPLSVIRMNMDLLAEDLEEATSQRERRGLNKVGIVQAQCKRLQNLLDDFLKYVRVTELDLKAGISMNRSNECSTLSASRPKNKRLRYSVTWMQIFPAS